MFFSGSVEKASSCRWMKLEKDRHITHIKLENVVIHTIHLSTTGKITALPRTMLYLIKKRVQKVELT